MICRSALAVTLATVLGCGAAQRPARPEPLAGSVKRYAPLALGGDARQPGTAVVLGTDDADGSTVLSIPAVPSTAIVDATALTTSPADPSTAEVVQLIPPATDEDPAVRAAVSSAARIAVTALGKDPGDVAFAAAPTGPAGSALFAAGFLAAMTGVPVDPAATVLGCVLPDGTLAPLLGAPDPLGAAIARGKTRIGVPLGAPRAPRAGQDVAIVELATVHDAFALVTGKRLPAPVPVSEAEMALDPATLRALDAAYVDWQKRLADQWAPLLQLESIGRLPATVSRLAQLAQAHAAEAEALRRAGKLPSAYGRAVTAWVYATAANGTYAVLARLADGDVDAAVAAFEALDTGDARTRDSFARLGAHRPRALGGHLALLEALQAALRGWSYHQFAADVVRATRQLVADQRTKPAAELRAQATAEAVAERVAPAVLQMLRATAEATVAEHVLALDPDGGLPYSASPARVARIATVLQAIAVDQVRHADAVLVTPRARTAGISEAEARRRAASVDPGYLLAGALTGPALPALVQELTATWGEGAIAASLLPLAAQEVAFQDAALLLTKHDSLGVHVDAAGAIDAIAEPQVLRALLASARRNARAHARAARIATGAIPVQARLAYQLAVTLEAGGLAERLDALADLWMSSAYSQTAVMLARSAGTAPAP